MNKLKTSQFNTFETLLTIVGIGLVSLGIYLSQNLSYNDVITSELTIVGDTSVGSARRKTERSFSWSIITQDEIVYNNDQIFTSSKEILNIKLENKGELEIAPNSLVRVVIDNSYGLGLNIDRGTLKVDATGTKQVVRINNGNSLVEVAKGGIVKIEKVSKNNFGVKLLKGSASIVNVDGQNSARVDLSEGESTLIDLNKQKEVKSYSSFLKTNVVDLLTQKNLMLKENTLEAQSDLVYVKSAEVTNDNTQEVMKIKVSKGTFDVSSLSFGKYLVSPTPEFNKFDSFDVVASRKDPIIVKNKVIDYDKPVEVELNIREGIKSKFVVEYPELSQKKEYIVDKKKLSIPSYDQENIKITVAPLVSAAMATASSIASPSLSSASSAVATVNGISYQKELNLKLKEPYQLDYIKSKSLEDKIETEIKLNRPLSSPHHKIELVEKETGALVPLDIGQEGVLKSTNLKAGAYQLKVTNENTNVKLMDKDLAIEESVLIKKKVKNKRDIIVNSFSWKAPGVAKNTLASAQETTDFVVEFFDSADALVMKKEVKENKIDFESKHLKNYKIKVSKKEGGVVKPLGEKNFSVKPPENINPREVKKYVMKYDSKNLCYRVKLPYYLTANKYFIEIYRDVEMTKIVREIWSNSSSFCWRSNRDGKYFFRYKYVDYWGSGSKYSRISEIIFPISPMTDF